MGSAILRANVVQGANASETWLKATTLIIENGRRQAGLGREVLNLVSVTNNALEVLEEVDELFRLHIGTKWISKGSDCIFPARFAKRNGMAYQHWSRSYWGRLTRYREKVDQLDFIVHRLEKKPQSKQLSCVTFDPEVDIQPHRPFNPSMPCLIAVDFKVRGGKINVFALFRSHDFGRKAYGNYIGLGKLLRTLSQRTGYEAGEVVCYSVSAHIRDKELSLVNAILEDCRMCYSSSPRQVEGENGLEAYNLF